MLPVAYVDSRRLSCLVWAREVRLRRSMPHGADRGFAVEVDATGGCRGTRPSLPSSPWSSSSLGPTSSASSDSSLPCDKNTAPTIPLSILRHRCSRWCCRSVDFDAPPRRSSLFTVFVVALLSVPTRTRLFQQSPTPFPPLMPFG